MSQTMILFLQLMYPSNSLFIKNQTTLFKKEVYLFIFFIIGMYVLNLRTKLDRIGFFQIVVQPSQI